MAKQQNITSTDTRSFDKDLKEDVNDFHLPSNSWTQARNAINNSVTGDLGKLGNEPSNMSCINAPYKIIGIIHLEADVWTIYSTDNVNSEIGIFTESKCGQPDAYTTAVNDPCLGFKQTHLIKGVSRLTSQCNYETYWDDGLNPSRYMNIFSQNPIDNQYTNPNSPLPWKQDCLDSNGNPPSTPGYPVGCITCTNLNQLDCDKLRLAKFIDVPCVKVQNGVSGGTLPNGSYFVAIAYSIKGVKISDYYISNIQPLFNHENTASSLDVNIESIDKRFDEFIIVIVSTVNQQTAARQAGIYSTSQKHLSFDIISNTWPAVPIEQLPLMNPVADRTDAMYTVNDYLLRVGPTSKEDFNYQPLANQIVSKWVSVEYDTKYYRNGGNNVGYLRDETYPYFIRWVYNTGDKSNSYHIPGRPATIFAGTGTLDTALYGGIEALPGDTQVFQSFNTATQVGPVTAISLPDGGIQIAEGYMGYWESSELYPDDKPQIWNANVILPPYPGTVASDYDLCNKHIRHHKFPSDVLEGATSPNFTTSIFNSGVADKIRIMGIKFENVLPPVMNDGITPVPGIVSYEILRGSRNGNKTVIAKGIVNNIGLYEIEHEPGKVGGYPNYPFNDLNKDVFLSTTQTKKPFSLFGGQIGSENYNPPTAIVSGGPTVGPANFSAIYHTFHSPDTNFTNPYLNAKEMKVYGNIYGNAVGKFEISEEHPKEKLLTNLAFLVAGIAGVGIASIATNGKKRITYNPPIVPGYSVTGRNGIITTTPGGQVTTVFTPPMPAAAGYVSTEGPIPTVTTEAPLTGGIGSSPDPLDIPFIVAARTALMTPAGLTPGTAAVDAQIAAGALLAANIGGATINTLYLALNSAYNGINTLNGTAIGGASTTYQQDDGDYTDTPIALRTAFASNLPLYLNYYTEGSDSIIRLIKAIVRYRDFALRYRAHALYNNILEPIAGSKRRVINESRYIGPQRVEFGTGVPASKITINNLYRVRTVAIELSQALGRPTRQDITRYALRDTTPVGTNSFQTDMYEDPTIAPLTSSNVSSAARGVILGPGETEQTASSYYVGLKQRLVNQYGQITDISQILIPGCVISKESEETPVLFGGDTYIGRYTEKNTFFNFQDWLYSQPDGAQLNYKAQKMFDGLYPRWWANFDEFVTSDFTSSIMPVLLPPWIINGPGLTTPSDFYALDADPNFNFGTIAASFRLQVKKSWFYLFNSGVRDFFVESEINIDLRDWGNTITEEHYDPYRFTDTKALFNTAIIKTGNYYKYDQSLSVSKLFINYTSWGSTQLRSYDPYLAETCFTYTPNKLIYSLPQQFESLKDSWLIFLANNYTNFLAKVTCVKPINKSGALIMFDTMSPIQFQGLDQLQTDLGTKLTIGDGGLFSQPMQNLLNADRPYEYGSCQDRLSVINTPMGIFWMSQNQGKIFQLQNGIDEISMTDLKWWFATYLPYKLTDSFPTFELIDNPVIGIGCQSIYDNENQLLYFCKRDFVLRTDLPLGTTVTYISEDNFNVNINNQPVMPIKLGDLNYFEDASWTVSYDPKTKGWISWHDWHPNLLMPGKNTFLSIKDNGVWLHNYVCNSYCNYYGINYPFEVEYMVNTIQTVNVVRSVEYIMEAYKYDTNCHDRFHVLDYNFDQAVVYNTEQVSGLLNLVLSPKNNPTAMIAYPIINATSIDSLFSKVENKYRFNQFWDITDDRGEYNLAAQRMIWNTAANGYVRVLNPNNLNYNKAQTQRKRFRHYTTSVLLRKKADNVGQPFKILVLLTNNKNVYSPR